MGREFNVPFGKYKNPNVLYHLHSLIKDIMMKRRREKKPMKPIQVEKRLDKLSDLRKSIQEVRI